MQKDRKPYIIIAQQPWALDLGSNARNMAMEISKERPVLYVNPAIDIQTIIRQIRTPLGKKRLKLALGAGENTTQEAPNLWVHTPATVNVSINWLRQPSLFNALNKRNGVRFTTSLRKAIKSLGWQTSRCTILNDSQMFVGLYLKDYLQPEKSFYYIRDNLVEHPYFKRHGSRIEPETIRCADAVFTNSSYLADYAKQYNEASFDIGQGCELDMYDATQDYNEPTDLAAIPHPRIGYTGFLTGERLDIALLESLALQRKDWQFVLIGPEEIMFKESVLHGMSNVHFLGSKKSETLPSYLRHLDVCFNPQLINALTVGNYPRKIDEYLAMGKPTVATDTPAMHMFLPYVFLAKGTNDYIAAIENALQPQPQGQTDAAIAFAKGHTWKACVNRIDEKQNTLTNA